MNPKPHVIVLFGATGDLARRKLLPGLLRLFQAGLMPVDFRIVGTSLDDLDEDGFRRIARAAIDEFSRTHVYEQSWEAFARRLRYVSGSGGPSALHAAVHAARGELDDSAALLHYLSVPPKAAKAVVQELGEAGLNRDARVVMEKPFGTDLASARELNAAVHEVFREHQVFRIDHFLGKEAAQNILALRFANGLFEPIWNRQHIDHVLIEVPETLSIGMRGSFYEATGAYRDMVVTHLFQVMAFMAMEPPTALEPRAITEEKNKVFRSMKPLVPADVVRGQYAGYRDEPGVAADSETETFVALRAEIDNWRWAGVPFYLRTGKRMAESGRIISIAYHEPPQGMFPRGSGVGSYGPDHLTFDLDEASRVSLSFYGKRPGPGMRLEKASMQFSLDETTYGHDVLEAYERLIHDAMMGDHTLFTTADGIERLWEVSAPLLESPPPLEIYPQGSWGPESQHKLIAPHRWRLPFERKWRGPVG
ncbi:glucose-6-phosphate dehydrogenase [Conexibacter stalactiti]|uniref:Glucose-6-phosphate 1-dehydrogenase n=1 Tax=Conexibacter stalactiti TaxID=1940611 RepID=A0ABU4HY06_9ACTN|nr:glucose-6-phosphate dehydrogenase [Conexibacter stalactiti]MDW5598110.1 glucose-6-phosphate dehydrogenase [Conexibacter stalactiti]MEC5038752.1 glucose-6-phosphate dehydrogenase [Conexibacter stalactiti]